MDTSERLCWFCRHFEFDAGSPHYSDLTPGEDMRLGCKKRVWSARDNAYDQADLARCIMLARDCRHFTLHEDVAAKIAGADKCAT